MLILKEYEKLTSELKQQRIKDRRKLNKEQRLALDLYFGNLYKGISPIGMIINYYVYSDGDTNYKKRYPGYIIPKNVKFPKLVKNLDYCIENSTIYYEKELFRGVSGDTECLNYKVGDSIEFTAFLSTSFMPFQALSYARNYKERGDKGLCGLLILKNYNGKVAYGPLEDEIVLPRNTVWRLTKITIKKLQKNYPGFIHPKHGNYSEYLGVGNTIKILTLEYNG